MEVANGDLFGRNVVLGHYYEGYASERDYHGGDLYFGFDYD